MIVQDIDASLGIYGKVNTNTKVVYQTNEGRYGVLLIADWDYEPMVHYITYNNDGSVHSMGYNKLIPSEGVLDLDKGVLGNTVSADIMWSSLVAGQEKLKSRNSSKLFVVTSDACDSKIFQLSKTSLSKVKTFPLSDQKINASNDNTNMIPNGTKIGFKSASGKYGLLEIETYGNDLIVNRIVYNEDGSYYSYGCSDVIPQGWYWDINTGTKSTNTEGDIYWEFQNSVLRYVTPSNGATLYVIDTTITANEEPVRESVILFPNPAKHFVNIPDAMPNSPIRLINNIGISYILFIDTDKKVNLIDINAGIYQIQYQNSKSEISTRLVIE